MQNVCRELGVDPPSSFIGNQTDDTAQRILQAARQAGRHLARRNWVALTYQHSFSTSSGITDYLLPTSPEWHHMLPGTAWDRTNSSKMRGSTTPAHWQRTQAEGIASTFFARPWRLKVDAGRVKKFALETDPGGVYVIAYEYVTDQWLFDGSSLYYADVTADSNLPVFDDYLMELHIKWRAARALGLPYLDDRADANTVENQIYAQERGAEITLEADVLSFRNNAPDHGYG